MKNVLLVDDDPIFNFINTERLKRTGMAGEIHTALNGGEAMHLLNNYLSGNIAFPEIILLDLNMPLMDGFGFIEAFGKLLTGKKEKVNIVVITSSDLQQDITRAKNLGITHYFVKPIDEDALKKILS